MDCVTARARANAHGARAGCVIRCLNARTFTPRRARRSFCAAPTTPREAVSTSRQQPQLSALPVQPASAPLASAADSAAHAPFRARAGPVAGAAPSAIAGNVNAVAADVGGADVRQLVLALQQMQQQQQQILQQLQLQLNSMSTALLSVVGGGGGINNINGFFLSPPSLLLAQQQLLAQQLWQQQQQQLSITPGLGCSTDMIPT